MERIEKNIEIDCRNLEGQDAIARVTEVLKHQKHTGIQVLVNTESAMDSLPRFLSMRNFQISVDSRVDVSIVEGIPIKGNTDPSEMESTQDKSMVFISSDYIGKEDDLGKDLMVDFIESLSKRKPLPWKIALVHCAVTLGFSPSKALDSLKLMETSGVGILVCKKSLKELGLDTENSEKMIGKIVDTMDILSAVKESEKVIRL